MSTVTAQTVLQQIRQHFKHLDLSLPKKLAAELAEVEDMALRFTPANAGGVAEALHAAQVAGRDPATDEAVRTALTRMLLVHHSGAINAAQESVQEKARRSALVKHAPDLIETMRPVVEAAERDIAKAREVLATDNLRLDDQKMIGSLDSSRLAPWANAREALLRVERVQEVWTYIASATRLAAVEPETKALIVVDIDDLQSVSRLDNGGFGDLYRKSDARAAVEAGLPMSLATFAEYGERVAAVNAREQANTERWAEEQQKRRFPSLDMVRVPSGSL